MFSSAKKKALIRAHTVANSREKPYLYLCCDVLVKHPYSFGEIRGMAAADDQSSVSGIGPYEDLLRPHVTEYLKALGFPYSAFEVDGARVNGRTNLGLWLTKPDMAQVTPRTYETALVDVSIVDVLEKIETWEEAEKFIKSREIFNAEMAESLRWGRREPLIAKFAYHYDSLPPERRYQMIGYEKEEFRHLPPFLWGFYGGQPASEENLQIFRDTRRDMPFNKDILKQTLR